MKPIIKPTTSKVTTFFTLLAKKTTRVTTPRAPTRAAELNKKGETESIPIAHPVNVTMATNRVAPEETPKTYGSAMGLRKKICSSSPLTANAAPPKTAASARGKRICMITV
jgi:hypothetical protein